MARTNTGNELSIRYTTTRTENGEIVYYAPIEIKDKNDLANYGITWDDCKTLHFGTSDCIIVYYFPTTNKRLAEFQWTELNTKHSKEYRSTRCSVPGKSGKLIRCPDTNRCRECPFGILAEDRRANYISLDQLSENGYEEAAEDRGMDMGLVKIEFESMRKIMDAKDPNIARAVVLREMYGYKVPEIARKLEINERQVYYCLQQARDIGKKYKKSGR